MKKPRLLSGIQPSGRLHLGNFLGAISNWVNLQDDYEAIYEIADLHALTTNYADTSKIKEDTFQAALDLLACGIDPKKSVLLVQSQLAQHSELHLILSMFTPVAWLERNPTYKSQLEELKEKDLSTYGFLGYPVLQAADILIYKAELVPVGKDQLPHLELTREIARRFNYYYGNIFPIPKEKLTQIPVLIGTDGRKMSKSYGNTIGISDSEENIKQKIRLMITDPKKIRKNDPGNPEICTIFHLREVLTVADCPQIAADCKNGKLGCVEDKNNLAQKIFQMLAPIQEQRKRLENEKNKVKDILTDGAQRARVVANETLNEVKEALGLLNG